MDQCDRYEKSCRSYSRKHTFKTGGNFPRIELAFFRDRNADSDSEGNSQNHE